MSKTDFTEEQKSIIEEKSGNILVSAAAGSGKTTVLVERIIRRIIEDDFSVDSLLIATFTRDAAENMRRKINDSLRARIRELSASDYPNHTMIKRLNHQLDLLPNAYIQTLNSFCARVIKEKGYLLEGDKYAIEPGIPVFDTNTVKILMTEAAGNVIESSYQDEDDSFIKLTYAVGDGRTNMVLQDSLVKIYSSLRSLPDYMTKLTEKINELTETDEGGILRGYDRFISDYSFLLHKIIDNHSKFIEEADGLGNTAKKQLPVEKMWYEYAVKITELINSDAAPREIYEIVKDISSMRTEYPGFVISKKEKEEYGEYAYRDIRKLYAPTVACILFTGVYGKTKPKGYMDIAGQYYGFIPEGCRDFFNSEYDRLLALQKQRTECIYAFGKLLMKLDEEYFSIKKAMHGMDFSDQEHTAYRILKTEEARLYYRNKFDEIFIDEYQDNSELQDAVIDSFSRAEGNVFRVGDVKQSIYKFRYAAPQLFINKADEYSDGNNGKLMKMSRNFRSAPEILDFVNFVFDKLMTREGAEIEYDDSQRLNSPEGKENSGKVPLVCFVDSGYSEKPEGPWKEKKAEARNKGVLMMVKKYLNEGVSPDKICVLSRKNNTSSGIASYLCANGIEARYKDETSIFDDKDIHSLCGFLIALSNQYRDEYLTGVLLSNYTFSNFTLDDLAEIMIVTNSSQRLYMADRLRMYLDLQKEDSELRRKIELFLQVFDNLRNKLFIYDIGQIIEEIYEVTGIRSTLLKEDGEKGILKLALFKDWLCDSYSRYGSDISGIAGLIENMSIKLKSAASISVNSTDENKVTCMTMHTSKGLEFERVILAGLDERSKADSDNIKFDSRFGFAMDNFEPESIRRYPSVYKEYFKLDNDLAENSEMLRVLYVALTRAKTELSIVLEGNPHSKVSSFQKYIELVLDYDGQKMGSDFWRTQGGNMKKALLAAILRTKEGAKISSLFEIETDGGLMDYKGFKVVIGNITSEDLGAEFDDESELSDDSCFIEENKEPQDAFMAIGVDQENRPVFKPYPYQEEAETSFKTSVSAIDSDTEDMDSHINLQIDDFDSFLDDRSSIDSPAVLGTFIHRLMRFFNFEKIAESDEGFEQEIQRLCERGVITKNSMESALPFEKNIQAFARSELGRKLAACEKNGRAKYELPVLFSSPVNDDYTLVQGVIDAAFEDEYGITIIDYKTDIMKRFGTVEAKQEEALKRHSKQLRYYAATLEASGHKVNKIFIWLIREEMAVEVKI